VRLKYYLRGIGVGVVITTLLFVILLSFNKNDGEQKNTAIEDTESKTVAEYENGEQNKEEQPDTEANPQPPEAEPLPETDPQPPEALPQPETDPQPNPDMPVEPEPNPESQPEQDPGASVLDDSSAKVRFVISGGEYSDVICRKLQEAGLIDDADAYNKFLVEEDYDNYINPGVYDIPKNATYEEIAVLLTTKVE